MFNRIIFSPDRSLAKIILSNAFDAIFGLLKLIRYYLFRLKIYLLGINPYRILPFNTIEKSYLREATNYRDFQWQTIISERGSTYYHKVNIKKKEHKRIIKEPERYLFLGNHSGIFSHKGIIYNKNLDAVVAETLEDHGNGINYSPEIVDIKYSDNIEKIKGLSLSICSILSDSNYAHFLLDAIPKLYLAQNLLSDVDNILISGSGNSFQRKILDYFNLPQNLIWLESESHFECNQLLFTSRLNNTTHACPWVVEAVRNLFLQNIQLQSTVFKPHKIIFASRKSASKRKTFLEELVISQLPEAEVVDFSELSMTETIKVCQQCKLFIGFHGAAFANLAFCSPGINVIELHYEKSPVISQHYFYSVAKYLKMNHQMITLSESMSSEDIKSIMTQSLNKHRNILV